APPARSTDPSGSGTITGPVQITVININSNTRATATDPFNYTAAMQITAASPNVGSALGGTDITIDGIGFLSPVSVTVGGVQATVLRVSGTELLIRTNALASPCANQGGAAIVVTNVDNGDFDTWGDAGNETGFNFIGVAPQITTITATSPPLVPGGSVNVNVNNPGV